MQARVEQMHRHRWFAAIKAKMQVSTANTHHKQQGAEQH